MKTTACCLALILWGPLSLSAQEQPRKIDLSRLGPKVGETVPDFRLQDAHGKWWTRDALAGPEGAMLVFSRSLDWCPYCKTQVLELQSRVGELKAKGLSLAVITYDSPAVLADFAKRRGITFPLLSDPGSQTIRTLGILNTTVDQNSTNFGIPFPGTFIINRHGVVTARFFEDAYQERTTVSNILLKLGGRTTGTSAQHISTDHLEAVTYATDDMVAPGSLFSLVVDIRPRPGMHLYAPGAASYRVVTLKLDPDQHLMARAIEYPASKMYLFKPLNETVPVFQSPFRLVQELSLNPSRQARAAFAGKDAVTIRGALEYQACDDKICYVPKSVPVTYTLKLRQLDTERANVGR
jgi:peroxiredoxin Q/BCP